MEHKNKQAVFLLVFLKNAYFQQTNNALTIWFYIEISHEKMRGRTLVRKLNFRWLKQSRTCKKHTGARLTYDDINIANNIVAEHINIRARLAQGSCAPARLFNRIVYKL